jgi:hypothetical protein
MVQQELAAGEWRESVQAKDWIGHLVAKVAGLSVETDKGRIKAIIRTWLRNGAQDRYCAHRMHMAASGRASSRAGAISSAHRTQIP